MYTKALEELRCFDAHILTDEDRQRTALYRGERRRVAAQALAQSPEEWLAALDLRVEVAPLAPENLKRAAQLLNKTNQMNLRTRRMSEEELLGWSAEEGHLAFAFSVFDRFGAYGLTGLASMTLAGEGA